MLHQRDNITTFGAAPAIPNLFLDIDRKPISAATYWTRAATLGSATAELDATARNFIFDRDCDIDHAGTLAG
jgi:hypothetical protein